MYNLTLGQCTRRGASRVFVQPFEHLHAFVHQYLSS